MRYAFDTGLLLRLLWTFITVKRGGRKIQIKTLFAPWWTFSLLNVNRPGHLKLWSKSWWFHSNSQKHGAGSAEWPMGGVYLWQIAPMTLLAVSEKSKSLFLWPNTRPCVFRLMLFSHDWCCRCSRLFRDPGRNQDVSQRCSHLSAASAVHTFNHGGGGAVVYHLTSCTNDLFKKIVQQWKQRRGRPLIGICSFKL